MVRPAVSGMMESAAQMDTCMLDTNIFNRVTDGDIPIEAFQGLRMFATHVQLDELNATKNPDRAAALLNVFERVAPDVVATSSLVWDVSRWGQANWTADDGVFQAILERLQALDAESGKTHRDPNNPVRDALIAETAIKNDLTLVSEDLNLRRVVGEFGSRAIDLKAALGRDGQDDAA